jgi:hypothetical protein
MLFQFPTNKLLVPFRAKHELYGSVLKGWIGHFEFVDGRIMGTTVYVQNPYASHNCFIFHTDPEMYLKDWELIGELPVPTLLEEPKP